MASSNLPHSDFAAQNDEELDTKELLELRQKCGRFRILVIGRANAGKTTLCQRMCNTEDPPIVHDKDGNVVNILPGQERGIHDINNEITYEANPGFVFHDSGGFESGSREELGIVRAFIKARAEGTDLSKQLHAIWICLPVDDDRPLLPTEMEFFKEESNSGIHGHLYIVFITELYVSSCYCSFY
ncbi:hypothetical protein VKT23_006367 [Stygiomarasmius scandens]|uniref:G domain-containing protein n=1 Tax=Marasmiellus scandens TaxID=2682957 RepID=A0ABR1JTW4_9AGAR